MCCALLQGDAAAAAKYMAKHQRGILRHSNSSIDVQCKTICYSWGKICCLGLEHSPHAATQYQQEINYDCIMGAMDANNEFSDPRTG